MIDLTRRHDLHDDIFCDAVSQTGGALRRDWASVQALVPQNETPTTEAIAEYLRDVNVKAEQRERLARTIEWARRLRTALQPLLDKHGDRVHFRPSSTGVAMVGLLPDRPQRGKSGIKSLDPIVKDFDRVFATYCREVAQGRATAEKALQSFLIRESYLHGRRIEPINAQARRTGDPVELHFVTDEISLPLAKGKIVCDILALRRDGGRCTPVLLELKTDRMLKRLVEQVEGYAALVDEHADLFADLFGALLGEPVRFDAPAEKWIVWPAAGAGPDPHEAELAAKGIRVVSYQQDYRLGVGRAPHARS